MAGRLALRRALLAMVQKLSPDIVAALGFRHRCRLSDDLPLAATSEAESGRATAVAGAIPAAADTSAAHQQASVEHRLVAMGFEPEQVTQALADSDVGGDPEKAVAFLLAQSKDGHAQGSSAMSPSTQEQAELLQWRSGTRRFVAEVIDLEAGVIETGAIVTAPPPPASSKRPLEVVEAGTSSGLSQVVQVKREKVEMQTKLREKESA